jgi:hypothetical protein
MELVSEALRLLRRQSELEDAMRSPGGIRVTEERDLYAIRQRLQLYPQAVAAILQTAADLHRPVDTLSLKDVKQST